MTNTTVRKPSDKSITAHSVFYDRDSGYRQYCNSKKDDRSECGLMYSRIAVVIATAEYKRFKKKNKCSRASFINRLNKINRLLADDMVVCLRHQKTIQCRKDCTIMDKNDKKNSPFLKWAGGKKKLIDNIRELMPVDIKTYVEPFVGAGSVALNIDAASVVINDINSDLIDLWNITQSDVDGLIEECLELFSGKYKDEQSYYKLREEFNSIEKGIRKSAIFVYLNRHCFNGLCRYNSKGGFNVPVGRYTTIGFPEEELRNAAKIIKDWVICNTGFREIMNELKEGDVGYCDPPYAPVTLTSFSDYTKEGFNEQDQRDLADAARKAADRGAVVIISNHDTEFTRTIYEEKGAVIHFLKVSRMIASKSKNRKAASELIAVFKK